MNAIKTRRVNISRPAYPCPLCGELSKRHAHGHRSLREIGVDGPVLVEVTYSKHFCETCRKHFSVPMDHLAVPSGRFTNRVRWTAVDLVIKSAMTLDKAALRMRQKYFVNVPPTTIHDWVRDAMAAMRVTRAY